MWKVYKITNKTYNEKAKLYKSYIGMTEKTVEERFSKHILKDSGCTVFKKAITKYGINNWEMEILQDNIKTEKEALELETFYIQLYNTLSKNSTGYNVIRSHEGRKIINGKLQCLKCDLNKNVEFFTKNKNKSCGYGPHCKECRKKYHDSVKDTQKFKEKRKIYRQENKEEIKKSKKAFRESNKDLIAAHKKAYYLNLIEINKAIPLEEKYKITPYKCCNKCKITKTTKNFSIYNQSNDGFNNICKNCDKEYKNALKNKKL